MIVVHLLQSIFEQDVEPSVARNAECEYVNSKG